LFASGDSRTAARLEAVWPRAIRHDESVRDPNALHMMMLERVHRRASEFDFMHFHLDYYPFSLFSRQPVPFVTTLHGRLDLPEHQPVFATFSRVPVISISNAQRRPVPHAGWVGTIYHGLPEQLLSPVPGAKPQYLAFLGRIAAEKARHMHRPAMRSAIAHRREGRCAGSRLLQRADQAAPGRLEYRIRGRDIRP
jgi:hypothetical protein